MSLVQRFLTGIYTVSRRTAGTYVRGEYLEGAIETIQVGGSLQPTNARELKLPEEGNRLKQWFKFYTDAEIIVMRQAGLKDSDRIEIDGESYRAMSSEKWQHTDLPYFMTVLYREPENA